MPARLPLGLAVLLLVTVSCSDDGTSPAAVPTAVRPALAGTAVAAAGVAMAASPSFVVTNAAGEPMAGVAVTVAVTEGGGTLTGAPTRTQAGPTSVGRWVLGTRAGRNVVQVRAGSLPPVDLVVEGVAGPPAAITAVAGNDTRWLAGTTAPAGLVLQVSDQFGNGVAGETVRLALDSAGSTLAPVALVTGADGRTTPAQWRLGTRRRLHTGRALLASNPAITLPLRAEFLSEYHIDVRFATEPTPDVRRIFEAAADRLGGLIIGDAPDVLLTQFDPTRCGGPAGLVTETVDDLIIYAAVSPIDGPGRVLGRAGPCFLRTGTRHTIVGTMQFDDADAQVLITSGRFEAVVLHEMLHVIGIGSLWQSRLLIEGLGTADPRVTGTRAPAECLALGFTAACGVGTVPAENTGGSGTAGSHWRESVFDAELMTGFAESTPNMPLSSLTAGGLEDLGYVVNNAAVDIFAAPTTARFTFPRAEAGTEMDVVLRPIGEISPLGWVRRYPQ